MDVPDEYTKKLINRWNALIANKNEEKMTEEGENTSKNKNPKLWISISLFLVIVIFIIFTYFLFNLRLAGEKLCQEFGYDQVYRIEKIKNLYYYIDCMKIENGNFSIKSYQGNFSIKSYQIWKKEIDSLGLGLD